MIAQSILLDTDVIVNWLTKETETKTHKELWKAPFEIISFIEGQKVKGIICLNSLLEIRFLMRRKKKAGEAQIKKDIEKISSLFDVVVPDEICLLRANRLQADHPLDPFDAILLATALSIPATTLVSRDNQLLVLAAKFIEASTPEALLTKL